MFKLHKKRFLINKRKAMLRKLEDIIELQSRYHGKSDIEKIAIANALIVEFQHLNTIAFHNPFVKVNGVDVAFH